MTPEDENLKSTPGKAEGETPEANPAPPEKAAPAPETEEEVAAEVLDDGKATEQAARILAAEGEAQAARNEAAEAKNALLRTAAEYDNYRKRTTKEKDAAFGNGTAWAVTALLPVADALELAAAADTADGEYKKGVEMTLAQLRKALELLGVSEIEALGLPFDPNLHAAVMRSEEGEAGTVTAVLQKGYKMGERVLRHASVAVAGE